MSTLEAMAWSWLAGCAVGAVIGVVVGRVVFWRRGLDEGMRTAALIDRDPAIRSVLRARIRD